MRAGPEANRFFFRPLPLVCLLPSTLKELIVKSAGSPVRASDGEATGCAVARGRRG